LPGFRSRQSADADLAPSAFGPVGGAARCLQSTLQASSAEAISERNLRPGPAAEGSTSYRPVKAPIWNTKWLSSFLPGDPRAELSPTLAVERLVVEVPDQDVDRANRAHRRAAAQIRDSRAPPPSWAILLLSTSRARSARKEIAGAGGKDRQIVLGAGSSIPGFEDQLVGAAAGEHRMVQVTLPPRITPRGGSLPEKDGPLHGRREGSPRTTCRSRLTTSLGRAVGLESLAELRQEIRQQMQRDYDAASPICGLKRGAARQNWRRVAIFRRSAGGWSISSSTTSGGSTRLRRSRRNGRLPSMRPSAAAEESGADTSPAAAEPRWFRARASRRKPNFRKIAERRVRLGLLLAEVGRRNNIIP